MIGSSGLIKSTTKMTQEKPVEELIYELGSISAPLETLRKHGVPGSRGLKEEYEHFKVRARKLGVELPDFTDDMIGQVLQDQIVKVEQYIDLHKSTRMIEMFRAGRVAEMFFLHLLVIAEAQRREDPAEKEGLTDAVRLADQVLSKLMQSAKNLGVVIGDQLEGELQKYVYNPIPWSDHTDIKIKLQKVMCGPRIEVSSKPPPQPESPRAVYKYKRSEIDPTRVITDECWTVSLARMPDRSNAEHAFIVLEGKSGGKSKIWFADFVPRRWFGVACPGTEDGKVRIEYHESEGITDPESRLLYKCQKKMMDVRASDRLLYSTWLIAQTTAENLIHMIQEQERNPPKYHALGHNSVLAKGSAISSSNETGHNCFTFAKMILRDLNDVFIELPDDGLETWIVSATSRYLVDKQFLKSRKWYRTPWSQQMLSFLTVGVVAGVVVSLLFKAFGRKE